MPRALLVVDWRESPGRSPAGRLRLLGPFAGRVTDQYRHLLEVALEDGQVTQEEAAQLRLGLAREGRLTKPEKERLAGLIGLWQRSEGLAGS